MLTPATHNTQHNTHHTTEHGDCLTSHAMQKEPTQFFISFSTHLEALKIVKSQLAKSGKIVETLGSTQVMQEQGQNDL